MNPRSGTSAVQIIAPRIVLYLVNAAIILFMLAPIIIVVLMSFSNSANMAFPPSGLSTRWYVAFLHSSEFMNALRFSIEVGLVAAFAATAMGLCATLSLEIGGIKGANYFKALFLAPLTVPAVVLGIGMLVFFTNVGLAGGRLIIFIAHTVIVFPFSSLLLSSGLQQMNRAPVEGARSLGASWLRVTFTVILPMIRVSIFTSLIFAFMVSIDEFVVTLLLAQANTTTLPVQLYNYVEFTQNPLPAAAATVVVAGTVIAVALAGRTMRISDIF